MSINHACNCCDSVSAELDLYYGYKDKYVKADFCKTSFQFLSSYQNKATGTLIPSVPPNPEEGSLFSNLSVSYSDAGSEEYPLTEGACFDVSGSDTFNIRADLIEKVDTELRIQIRDLNRGGSEDQLCSSACGGSGNPILFGNGGRDYYSERTYLAGNCDDSEVRIQVDDTATETFAWSVDGCRAFERFQPAFDDYPSALGTATVTTTSEANCDFNFVCGAVRYTSPDPNPYENTTVNEYNIVDLPFNLEKTTATAVDPIDISDVIDAAYEKLESIEYFAPEGETHFWNLSSPQTEYSRSSSPFSESGFNNYAELTLSQKEYIIRIGKPSPTCYIKLWFEEQFLPSPIPEDWPLNPVTGQPIPETLSSFEIEHNFSAGGEIPKKCYKSEGIDFMGEDGSFVPENSTLITPEPRTLTPPTTNGTKFISLIKWSALKGYTPNTPYLVDSNYTQGCKPDGFPNPEMPCE